MGKEKQALKPDIIVKNYWRNKEQFADFSTQCCLMESRSSNRKNWRIWIRKNPPFWSIKNMRKASERREIRSKFEKVYRIWRGICYTGNGRTGAYSLCDAHAGNGV